MTLYAGLDLGKRKSHLRVINAAREVVEDVSLENDPKEFARAFARLGGDVEVACEASSNAFWVADTLEPLVRKVHVGDTKKIRWIAEARVKTDRLDAGILAELLRADLFPDIHIPPKKVRELRELVRGLIRTRRQVTRLRNQVHGLLCRQGVAYVRREVKGPKLRELVRESELPRPARVAAESLLRLEEAALEEAKVLEREIAGEVRSDAELGRQAALLGTIPGVGTFSALLIILELWDVKRFRDAKHLASYIGLVPSTHQSGETRYNGRLTRQGNALLRWILVQDAYVAAWNHEYFGRLYRHHKARLGRGRAVIPVARALLETIWRVWTAQKSYDELFTKKAWVG